MLSTGTGPLTLTFRGLTFSIDIDGSENVSDLKALVERATGIHDCSIKVLMPGKKAVQLDASDLRSLDEAGESS